MKKYRTNNKNYGMRKSFSHKSLIEQNISLFNNNINTTNTNSNINKIKRISIKDFQKKINKNPTILPNFNSKKKKGNILSRINFNIQNSSQNLNNPDEFYSNYFNSILKGEIKSKNINKISANNLSPDIYDSLKSKKEKKIKK